MRGIGGDCRPSRREQHWPVPDSPYGPVRNTGSQFGRYRAGAHIGQKRTLRSVAALEEIQLLTSVIVDDSPQFLEAAGQLLADDGIEVLGVALTSADAVELTIAMRPDLVLVDVGLGEESGLELAGRLLALGEHAPLVILISAESRAELADLVDASRVLGFISKTELSGDAIRRLTDPCGMEG
jgi:CheY-like chemotaxis protein